MKITLNIITIIVALFIAACGIYFGIWIMLVGGIVNIIDGAKMNPTDAMMIAKGIAKVIFFELPTGLGLSLAWITLVCGIKK
jgi:hypothetical protein